MDNRGRCLIASDMRSTIPTRRQFLRTSIFGCATTWSVPIFLERTLFTILGFVSTSADAVAEQLQDTAIAAVDKLPLLGPYLLLTGTPYASIRVAFRGTEPATIDARGELSYGIGSPDETKIPFDAAPNHVLEIGGLSPGTTYKYRLKLGDYLSPVYSFRTAPAPGTRGEKTRVLILSDFHVQSPTEVFDRLPTKEDFFRRYAEKMADMRAFRPDLILLPGDIVHVGGRREEYETLLRLMRELFATAIVLPCPGNHELKDDRKLANYSDFFPDPIPVTQTGAWSMAYGGVGFVTHGGGPWLEGALTTLKNDYKTDTIFYTLHAPLYLWSDKATDEGTNKFTDLFDTDGNVRICFAGHYHMPQRTFPLLKDQPTTAESSAYGPEVKGTIYLQIPSIWYQYAQPHENPRIANNAKLAGESDLTGFTEMTITPGEIVVETYGYGKTAKHSLIDRFTLARKN